MNNIGNTKKRNNHLSTKKIHVIKFDLWEDYIFAHIISHVHITSIQTVNYDISKFNKKKKYI